MVSGDTNHSEMFVVSGDLIQPLDVLQANQDPAVPLIERDIRLINVVGLFLEMNGLEGLVKQAKAPYDNDVKRRYGAGTPSVARNSLRKHEILDQVAQTEFDLAIGYTATVAMVGKSRAHSRAWGLYKQFKGEFKSPKRAQEREGFIKKMRDNVRILQSKRTIDNRQTGLRPHAEDAQDDEGNKLSSNQRLQVLIEDPRAGFYPTTNREKTTIMTFLDYLDNPEFPIGINNQLFEVHAKRSREGMGEIYGIEAMRSIAYELTDYLHNAAEQLILLENLRDDIKDCPNPALSLKEGIGPDHEGYPALVRYFDLVEFTQKATVKGLGPLVDPLKVREDRRPHPEPHKNKTVEDQYTSKSPDELYIKRVAQKVDTTTVGSVRKTIDLAILDQQKRFEFMYARLDDTKMAAGKRQFKEVRRVAVTALKEFDEVA